MTISRRRRDRTFGVDVRAGSPRRADARKSRRLQAPQRPRRGPTSSWSGPCARASGACRSTRTAQRRSTRKRNGADYRSADVAHGGESPQGAGDRLRLPENSNQGGYAWPAKLGGTLRFPILSRGVSHTFLTAMWSREPAWVWKWTPCPLHGFCGQMLGLVPRAHLFLLVGTRWSILDEPMTTLRSPQVIARLADQRQRADSFEARRTPSPRRPRSATATGASRPFHEPTPATRPSDAAVAGLICHHGFMYKEASLLGQAERHHVRRHQTHAGIESRDEIRPNLRRRHLKRRRAVAGRPRRARRCTARTPRRAPASPSR